MSQLTEKDRDIDDAIDRAIRKIVEQVRAKYMAFCKETGCAFSEAGFRASLAEDYHCNREKYLRATASIVADSEGVATA